MDTLSAYLPPHSGLLPKWLLLVSTISLLNSLQSYSTLKFTTRVYAGSSPSTPSPVTPLSARTFGTWTALSSIIRLYAAYHIGNPEVYQLAMWSYGLAFAHFGSEWLAFGTARWGAGLAGPAVVSTVSMAWMWMQYGFYVR
ncbi:ergosterol 28 [Aulographum hederae CBS 113979]|uniref:Ergosterol 28 n=1 Tax=Aulographum hederae CBS 113979 TaxID=1176131 RepID=A0A6G1H2V0_9PEZI|nr:ergosterol 28 [Aulographum hederae CBS 113979]